MDWVLTTKNVFPNHYDLDGGYPAALEQLKQELRNDGTWHFGPYEIQRCFSEISDVRRCQLQFISSVLYGVIACHVIKVACMCAVVRYLDDLNEPILATVGDATASFLEHGDETTEVWFLIGYKTLKKAPWRDREISGAYDSTYKRKPST